MRMSSNVAQAVADIVTPILDDLSLELYDCEFAGGTLRVTIDTPAGGESGVDIDRIALVNRLLGRELDHNDVVPGRYTLEVTSPGLERPLRTAAHFRREVGKVVNVRFTAEVEGLRRVTGRLESATEVTATVVSDDAGARIEFPLAMVDRAKTVFVWQAQPKPNSPEARRARRGGPEQPNAPRSTEVSAT